MERLVSNDQHTSRATAGNVKQTAMSRLKLNCVTYAGLIVLTASGCSTGLHFHSEADQKLAQNAQQQFQESQLVQSLVDEKQRMLGFQERELELVRRHYETLRDNELFASLGKQLSSFRDEIDNRIKQVVGSQADLNALVETENAASPLVEALRALGNDYKEQKPTTDDPKLVCPGPPQESLAFSSELLKQAYIHHQEACQKLRNSRKPLVTKESLIAKKIAIITDAENEKSIKNSQLAQARKEYTKAKADYEEAVKAGKEGIISQKSKDLKDKLANWAMPLDLANKKLDLRGSQWVFLCTPC